MNNNLIEKLKSLKISNYIYGIFILISLFGLFSNKQEKDYFEHINQKGKSNAHKIRLTILTISLIIYIYFLERKVTGKEKRSTKFLQNLDILAAILFVIGGIIFLYEEYKQTDPIIIE